jgi:hypothetical protein
LIIYKSSQGEEEEEEEEEEVWHEKKWRGLCMK